MRKCASSPEADVIGPDSFLNDLTVDEIMMNSVKLSNEEKGCDVDGFFEPATVSGAKKYHL